MTVPEAGGKTKNTVTPLTYHLGYTGRDYAVTLRVTSYYNGNLAIALDTIEDGVLEDFGTITVNFQDELLSPDQAYLDTNNLPEVEDFIRENQLGNPTGKTKTSGFCTYPLYELDLDKCLEHGVLIH